MGAAKRGPGRQRKARSELDATLPMVNLSAEAINKMAEVIENPPAPSEWLLEAAEEHRSRGRPRKAANEKRGTALLVRLTDTEKADLETVAEACGLSSADYLRRAAAYCRALGVPLARVTVGPLPPGLEVE